MVLEMLWFASDKLLNIYKQRRKSGKSAEEWELNLFRYDLKNTWSGICGIYSPLHVLIAYLLWFICH